MRRHAVGRAIAGSLLAAASLGGCASSPAIDSGIASVDGGSQITVPVPWANPLAGVGGIEPATVWVGDDRDTDFSIDLSDLEAQGAGVAWTAASATAAAVGTLYSGGDPRETDVWFTVSGPIDGPSAGALLTVAVLAALRDAPLREGMTLTGAVSPDGTISAVGGVGLKLRAAAEAGLSTVLLPVGNTTLTVSGSGELISAVDAARQFGVEVRHVATIAEAFEELTGQPFITVTGDPYVLPDPVLAAGEQTARDLVAETARLAQDVSTTSPELAIITGDLDAARTHLANGNPAAAYARATEALLAAGRAVTQDDYRVILRGEGIGAARERLAREVSEAIREAESALAEGANAEGLGVEASLSIPPALAWSAYARAALRALASALPALESEQQLLSGAAVLSEQRLSVEYLQPDALQVVRAMPSQPRPSGRWLEDYLSGYTNFLVAGAQANARYIADVVMVSIPDATVGSDDVRSLAPILAELAQETSAIDVASEDVPDELVQSAVAITDFVATTAFISATQGYGLDGFNMVTDAPTIPNSDSVRDSFDTSRAIVASLAALVSEQGSDAGYAVWSAEWGSAAFEDLAQEDRAGAGAVLAFNELWFDALNLQMIYASAASLRENPVS